MKIVLYLRRSTDRQEQSIGDQRKALLDYADRNGHEVVREYVDDAISGAMTEDRKEFLRMVEDAGAKPRKFSGVLVYDVSRFGRTGQDEAGYWRHTLSKAGVEVLYAAEGLTGTDADDLLRTYPVNPRSIDQFCPASWVPGDSRCRTSSPWVRGRSMRRACARWSGNLIRSRKARSASAGGGA